MFIFTNVIGSFVFDENYNVVDKILFKGYSDYVNRDNFEQKLDKKYRNLIKPSGLQIAKLLEHFKDPNYHSQFYKINSEITKEKLRHSVKVDNFILQAISTIEETDKVINILTKRAREWYSFHNPEAANVLKDNKRFIELLLSGQIKKEKDSIGNTLSKDQLQPVMILSKQIVNLYSMIKNQEQYLGKLMKNYCPNILALTGDTIGAKLLQKAGTLKKLSMFPASTIQLLGAEKALFRHLKNKKYQSPKFGVLHDHPLVLKAKRNERGRIARILADKICIAAKVDYFKGKYVGDKLLADLERRLK